MYNIGCTTNWWADVWALIIRCNHHVLSMNISDLDDFLKVVVQDGLSKEKYSW